MNPTPSLIRAATGLLALALGLVDSPAATSPSSRTDHDAYYPGEPIAVSFADGPGNPKDWIGIYPTEVVPGSVGSTLWNYVDGTQAGSTGLREGTVRFPAGLALAGDWAAYLLLNDGYTTLTTNLFRIVDPGTPLVRVDQRVVATGQAIQVSFTNGPASAKDWVGLYLEGQVPGGATPSTLWFYVDGTQSGGTALGEGTVTFPTGLTAPGAYVAHFLSNDGYDILASERFTVAAPTGTGPRLLSSSPADGSSNQPPVLRFRATMAPGSSPLVDSSLVLRLDGVPVPAQLTGTGTEWTVSYTNASLPAAGSSHVWNLSVADTAVPPHTLAVEIRTTIGDYHNVVLPSPLYFENFDGVAEGSLPTGWTGTSFTEISNPDEDLGNLDSATYARWTTVAADRFTGSFVTYSNPDNPADWGTDYHRVLTGNPFNVLNGAVFAGPLASGRFLFGNSGYRNGRSQVLFVTTPDYDLSGRTNVHIAFKSLWEQNQDSLALVEYSVDQGASWLPAAYFIDAADLVTVTDETTGLVSLDVQATLGTERPDIAVYTDDQGIDIGGTYGAFLGAPISQDLAPFLHGRVNDNSSESKRIELLRLAMADGKPRVRIRFGHAGTDSWYFGIDDFGVYSISDTPSAVPPLTVARNGQELVLSWAESGSGLILETTLSLSPASWSTVPAVTGNSHRVVPTGNSAFYRLRR